jgi:formate hydrogenlyase subunit 6/NADH:ubiquinone oxidoreductase subunit I
MRKPGKMLGEVLGNATRKPATVLYPFVPVKMCKGFRGKLSFDAAKCIGCKLCMRDCPSGAINIRKVADKQFEADIDMSRCIYCAQCVDTCPKDALAATGNFELAQLDRSKLKEVFRRDPAAAPVAPAGEDPKK